MSRPAIAGPMTKARLSRVDQALLAGPSSASSRTRLGRYAPMVGPKKHEKQVARTASATIAGRGPWTATSQAIASMIAPRATSVTRSTRRRSKRSATIPAGIDRRT